jgi:CRISPR-associated protein Csb2
MYTCEGEVIGPSLSYVGFELVDPEDPDSPKAFSPERWGEIVGWLRHIVAEALEKKGSKPKEWIGQKVLGHPEVSPHFYFLPVPSVGHPHADGFIRRVMICWDSMLIDDVKEDDLREALRGEALVSEEKREEALLRYGTPRFFERFVEPKSEWESVSPIVLHGYDHRHGKFSYKKCQLLILQAFKTSGYGLELIEEISFQKGPFTPGTLHVVKYFVPNHLRGFPMYHIRVKFKKPVRGPVVVGRGRFYGLGLLIHKLPSMISEQVPEGEGE